MNLSKSSLTGSIGFYRSTEACSEKVVNFAINSKLDTKPHSMKQKILFFIPAAICIVTSFAIACGITKVLSFFFIAIWAKPDWPLELVWAFCHGAVTVPLGTMSFFYICNWLLDRPFWHRFDNRYGTAA